MNAILPWTLSLLAGFIALVLLGLRMSFVTVNYMLLLAVTLYHGFYGLHNMLTEFWTGRRAGLLIGSCCAFAGIGLFALAVYASVVL